MGSPEANRDGLRFSLRTLLIGMALIAALIPLGGYTLRHASSWVGSLVLLVTSILLAGTACMAFNRTGASRAWWTGCAIFGIAYFVIGGDPWSLPYNYELFTETISTAAYSQFYPEGNIGPPADKPEPIPAASNELPLEDAHAPLNAVPNPPDLRDFVMVAHMYWSLMFAFCGGWMSLLMYWTGRRQAPES